MGAIPHGNYLGIRSLFLVLRSLGNSLQLGLQLSGLGLLDQKLLSLSLGLLGVDGLHQHSLVLELVTLGGRVQFVVKVLVDLLGLSVLSEQTAKDTLSSHPEDLVRHTGVARTLSLTEASVTSLSLGSHVSLMASLGVNQVRSLDDEAILDKLADILTAVGQSNVGSLVRVHPDLSLADLEHRGCKSDKNNCNEESDKRAIGENARKE